MSADATARHLRILLVLIHHGDEARVGAARSTVSEVAGALAGFGDVDIREIWRQPEVVRVGLVALAARRIRQWGLERRWALHLGVGRRWILSTGLLFLRLVELLGPETRRTAGRRACIELVLSAKHALAWRTASEDDADLLVVLEDDARTHPGSKGRIRELIRFAQAEDALDNTFIDLAGGLSREELRLWAVEQPRGSGIVTLSSAATNTTCGYLAGREVVSRFVAMSVLEPGSARLPSDWVINRCFMRAKRQGLEPPILCVHSDPHALSHGSIQGTVASSTRA